MEQEVFLTGGGGDANKANLARKEIICSINLLLARTTPVQVAKIFPIIMAFHLRSAGVESRSLVFDALGSIAVEPIRSRSMARNYINNSDLLPDRDKSHALCLLNQYAPLIPNCTKAKGRKRRQPPTSPQLPNTPSVNRPSLQESMYDLIKLLNEIKQKKYVSDA